MLLFKHTRARAGQPCRRLTVNPVGHVASAMPGCGLRRRSRMRPKPLLQLSHSKPAIHVQADEKVVRLAIVEAQAVAIDPQKGRSRRDSDAFVAVDERVICERLSQSAVASCITSV